MHTLSDISTYQQQTATTVTTTPATAATQPLPSATAFSPPNAAASDAYQHSSQDRSHTAQRAAATPEARDHSGSADVAFVLLPRMQMGMTHIATAACYTAVANVARTLAKSAVAADRTNATSAGKISGAQLHLAAMLAICVAFWDVLAFSGLGHLWDGCSKSSRPCFSLA